MKKKLATIALGAYMTLSGIGGVGIWDLHIDQHQIDWINGKKPSNQARVDEKQDYNIEINRPELKVEVAGAYHPDGCIPNPLDGKKNNLEKTLITYGTEVGNGGVKG